MNKCMYLLMYLKESLAIFAFKNDVFIETCPAIACSPRLWFSFHSSLHSHTTGSSLDSDNIALPNYQQ